MDWPRSIRAHTTHTPPPTRLIHERSEPAAHPDRNLRATARENRHSPTSHPPPAPRSAGRGGARSPSRPHPTHPGAFFSIEAWWTIVAVPDSGPAEEEPAAAPASEEAPAPAAPTRAAQADSQDKTDDASVPREHKAALNKAQTYSDLMHMSKAGIYDQLTSDYGEKFTQEQADYAIAHLND